MSKLTKTELVAAIAIQTNENQETVSKVLSAFTDEVVKAVQNGKEVPLPKFGTFKRSERAARPGRNPATGESIQIAASSNLSFKASQAVKDVLNA